MRIQALRLQTLGIQALGGLAAIAAVTFTPVTVQAESVADFYKGKNVELLIGYSGGGGYDVYARLLARHMGKHIPGNPNIVPRNMNFCVAMLVR